MLDILLILLVLFLILTFFYKQSICEFRINQLEWTQRENIIELLQEKVPLVVRSIPSAAFWTHMDVQARNCFSTLSVFQDITLPDWLLASNQLTNDRLASNQLTNDRLASNQLTNDRLASNQLTNDRLASNRLVISCPWKHDQAELIASASGISIWAAKWLNPAVISRFMSYWLFPKYYCWASNVGLRKMSAITTCIFPVDGEITVSLLPESVESYLPASWNDCFPSELTIKDTPFIADVKYIDIVLRPGSCLFVPAHWFVAWTQHGTAKSIPMVCQISYHSPISYLAYQSRKVI